MESITYQLAEERTKQLRAEAERLRVVRRLPRRRLRRR